MPRRPHPAATTSTLARKTDAEVDAEVGSEPDPLVAAPERQLPVPGTEAPPPVMASHPPAEEAPRRRPGRPRGAGRAPTVAAGPSAPSAAAVAAASQPEVELTDQDLQDLGSLTRLSMKLKCEPSELVPLLEAMLAAYRKAQL